MKKEIIKNIPAVEARPATTETKTVVVCDFCTKKTADHYNNKRKCIRCDRDICYNHQYYDPEESGDYGGYYCPICMRLYNDKYQKLMYALGEKHYQEELKLLDQMKSESLEGDNKWSIA
jgi:late competence protein required for DNA uptake (superfamily II DNA/RNA helicase)